MKRAATIGFLLPLFLTSPATPQQCETAKAVVDNNCAGCVTVADGTCSPGASPCEPCSYSWSATLTCPGWSQGGMDSGTLGCPDGKVEVRFGGCPSGGNPWGWYLCERVGPCP